jgi:hypothetical protein
VIQHRYLNLVLGMIIGLAAFMAGLVGQAYAHPTAKFLRTKTTLRVTNRIVLQHHLRICSWRPGDHRVRGLVKYSKHLATVPGWAGAGRHTSRAACSINGGTYRTAHPNYLRPSGTVYAMGRKVRGVMDAPAVGFLSNGRVIFGAHAAYHAGSREIVNALSYLVSGGKPLLHHSGAAWTTPAQFSCGPPGSDGTYGCSRSVLAQFKNGRVGLVEIGHASMPLAARILVRLHAREAVTFDSGGAALMWSIVGSHNTGRRTQAGHLFGVTAGTPWHRRVADAIVINARKLA